MFNDCAAENLVIMSPDCWHCPHGDVFVIEISPGHCPINVFGRGKQQKRRGCPRKDDQYVSKKLYFRKMENDQDRRNI